MPKRLETRSDTGTSDVNSVAFASCRHCRTEFDGIHEDSQHLCPGRVHTEFEDVTPEVTAPTTHEQTWKFAFDTGGLQAYGQIVSNFDQVLGKRDLSLEFEGDTWHVVTKPFAIEDDRIDVDADDFDNEEGYIGPDNDKPAFTHAWDGGIAARDESYDTYREMQVALRADDDVFEKKVSIQFRPSFPKMEFFESGEVIKSVPRDLPEGVRVEVNSSNVPVGVQLKLIQRVTNLLDVSSAYFRTDNLVWSTLTQLARYVRLRRLYGKKLVAKRGPLERIANLSSNIEGSKGKFSWDNQDIEGSYQAVESNPTGWSDMLPGQEYGKRAKYYHPKFARADEVDDDALSSPKFEVQYNSKLTDGSVSWEDRNTVKTELDETLLNVMHWAGIRVGADAAGEVFRPDAYFDADSMSAEDVRVIEDPTPELKATEETLATQQLQYGDGTLTEKRKRIIDRLIQAGPERYDDLAEAVDAHVSTVYRTIQDFENVLDSQNGRVDFLDGVVRERIESLVGGLRQLGARGQQSASDLVDIREALEYKDSAFGRWIQAHGVRLAEVDRDAVEIDFSSLERGWHTIRKLLRAGYIAAVGGKLGGSTFLNAQVRWVDEDGVEHTNDVDHFVQRRRLEDLLTWEERDDVAALQ